MRRAVIIAIVIAVLVTLALIVYFVARHRDEERAAAQASAALATAHNTSNDASDDNIPQNFYSEGPSRFNDHTMNTQASTTDQSIPQFHGLDESQDVDTQYQNAQQDDEAPAPTQNPTYLGDDNLVSIGDYARQPHEVTAEHQLTDSAHGISEDFMCSLTGFNFSQLPEETWEAKRRWQSNQDPNERAIRDLHFPAIGEV